MADRLMIDIRQVKATNESYLKERWIRMNWRKNYREKLAQKVKFRQEEIDAARNDMETPSAAPTPVVEVENIEEDAKSEVQITIPTKASEQGSPKLTMPTPSPLTSKPASRRPSAVRSSIDARSRKLSTQSYQSIPIKPVELIRSQVNSANSQRRQSNSPSTSRSTPRLRAKSAHVRLAPTPESICLSGKRIPLTDRETLWSTSVHVNKTTPEASRTYLNARKGIHPEQKYDYPHVSSFDYGWRINERMSAYKPPLHGRSQTIQATFYRGNGVLRKQHSLYWKKLDGIYK